MDQNDREAPARRVDEKASALRATLARMGETDAQIRALLAEQREGIDRVSKSLNDIDAALGRIEQRRAERDETDDDPHAGCIQPHLGADGEHYDCDGRPL